VAVVVAIALVIALLAVEGAWLFFARTNISDAAEEGAAVAAANIGTTPQVAQSACRVIDVNHPTTGAVVTLTPSGLDGSAGDTGSITVSTPLRSFSGILSPLFRRITVSSTVDFTLRRPEEGQALWWNDGRESTHRCR
jgi:uncharacterized membrane protein